MRRGWRRLLVALAVAAGTALAASIAVAQEYAEGIDLSATAGQQFTSPVASFTYPIPEPPDTFSATIDWGDGTPQSTGAVFQVACPLPDQTCYEVRGTHTYASPGTYTLDVVISGPDPGEVHVSPTATVRAPSGGPPPGGPTARIALVDSKVSPGEPAIVDASGSSGDIKLFAFDLNGNGTYETKSSSAVASIVHADPGRKKIGVQITSADGGKDTAATNVDVAGAPIKPPGGQQPFENGTVVGSVHASKAGALAGALIKNYNCPTTVQVGVAEATMAPTWSGDPCFERKTKSGLKHPAFPQFLATKQVIDQALLNGLHVVGGQLLISESEKWIEARKGSSPAKVDISLAKPPNYGGAFSPQWEFGRWDVSKPGTVATFPDRLTDPEFLGLPVVKKDTAINFTAGQQSEFQVFVVLPFSDFTLWPKNPPTGKPFTVRADNTSGLQVEGSYTYAFDLPLGIFQLKGSVAHSLEGTSHVWSGNITLQIPETPVDNIKGQMKIRDGEFEQATVSLPFKRPGLGPIGCCIYLVQVDGKLTQHAIEGKATFAAGPQLIGDFRAAEATATVSWQFSPFVLAFKAGELRIAKFPVNANTQAVVSKSYFLAYAFWDDSFGPFSHKVNVEVRVGQPWWVAGGGTACFEVLLEGCAEVYGAAGPKGIAACGSVLGLSGGVRVPWNPTSFSDWSGWWGCGFTLVKQKVGAAEATAIRAKARAAGAAGASYRVKVAKGLRGALFAIEGLGSQPQVELRGPKGPTITTPPPGEDTAQGQGWFATRDTNDDTTYVAVSKPAAGTWRTTELTGSPAVRSIGLAEALPSRFARGKVSGKGRKRTLRYKVDKARGTKVTFVERGGDPTLEDPESVVEGTIGTAKRSKGNISFTPAEAKVRKRRVVAVVESQGTTIKTEQIDTFKAPRFRLPAAPRVKVKRRGRALQARWREVRGARRYQAFVNQSDGETRYLPRPAGKRSVRVKGITALSSATVEVRAVSGAGYIGKSGIGKLSSAACTKASMKLRKAKRQLKRANKKGNEAKVKKAKRKVKRARKREKRVC